MGDGSITINNKGSVMSNDNTNISTKEQHVTALGYTKAVVLWLCSSDQWRTNMYFNYTRHPMNRRKYWAALSKMINWRGCDAAYIMVTDKDLIWC